MSGSRERTSVGHASVAVIGAGVAGLAAALALTERGARVRVYERAAALGEGACSWQAGGMLAPWCERDGAGPELTAQGEEALAWWPRHHPATVQRGTLAVAHARDRGELEKLARRSGAGQWLDGEGIAALEPALAGRFEHGLWFAREAHLDPREALHSLAAALGARGVPIQFHAEVDATDLVADTVVDCRGLAARDALPDLRGVRGETLVLRTAEVAFQRPLRLLHPRHPLYLVPRADGRLLLGATVMESGHAGPVTARAAMELLNAAWALHPALAEAAIVELGVGVRPALPDHLPCLLTQGRITHFNGLYRHGFLLAPWYAQALARQLFPTQEARA